MILKKQAFSLMELMIVIAIIGILGVVAIPSYKSYTIKAQLSKALDILESIKEEVIAQAVINGSSANLNLKLNGKNIMVNGVYQASGATSIYIDMDPVKYIWLQINSETSISYCLSIAKLHGIPNYVEPTATNYGTNSSMCGRIELQGDTYKLYCDLGSTSIPKLYAPAFCA